MNARWMLLGIVGLLIMFSFAIGCEKAKETAKRNSSEVLRPLPDKYKKELAEAKLVLIDYDKQLPPGKQPVMHIWKSLSPRKRACSVKIKTSGKQLGETLYKGKKYIKVQTNYCTGYVPERFIKPLHEAEKK